MNTFFSVSEAVNNKMMYYAGVMTEAQIEEESRVIQFPKGEYLVVKGEDKTAEELSNKLTGIAFGQAFTRCKRFCLCWWAKYNG